MMRLHTEREKLRGVAARWERSYRLYLPGGKYHHEDGKHGFAKTPILAALQALDPETCTAAEVNAIIGNTSWTTERCDECDGGTWPMVSLGVDPDNADYEERYVLVCLGCMAKAAALTTL